MLNFSVCNRLTTGGNLHPKTQIITGKIEFFHEPTFAGIKSAQLQMLAHLYVAELPRLPRYGHRHSSGLIRNNQTTVGKGAMSILSEIFSWWGGNTWGTRITLMRQGRFVGEDDNGNKYYEQRSGVGSMGIPRRWVTYQRHADPTLVTPDWHGCCTTPLIPPQPRKITRQSPGKKNIAPI